MAYSSVVREININLKIKICDHCDKTITRCKECGAKFKDREDIYCYGGHTCKSCYAAECAEYFSGSDCDTEKDENKKEMEVISY